MFEMKLEKAHGFSEVQSHPSPAGRKAARTTTNNTTTNNNNSNSNGNSNSYRYINK